MRFMRATGQTWKFAIPFALTVVSGAMIPFQFTLARLLGTEAGYIALLSLAVGVPTFLLSVVSVQCPHCALKIVWYAITKKDHREWFTWLITVERCPKCGYVVPGK
jgi:uncharacterized membrane protein YdcZ (DUF606 family)